MTIVNWIRFDYKLCSEDHYCVDGNDYGIKFLKKKCKKLIWGGIAEYEDRTHDLRIMRPTL